MDRVSENHHADQIIIDQTNDKETLILTASADHRISVSSLGNAGNPVLIDVFGAHDAEVKDVKWFHSSVGTYFVTIGNDLQARIWTQDTSQAPRSGRRFKKIASIKCESYTPFTSVDVRTIGRRTYIALINREGLLSLYEPSKPDQFKDWSLVDRVQTVSPIPGRGHQTAFKVVFDQNHMPLPYINALSEDDTQLTIAVTALEQVKLYRTTNDRKLIDTYASEDAAVLQAQGATRRMCLFEVLRILPQYSQPQTSAGSVVRDVAFRPLNVKGKDIIAIANINGAISLYEIQVHRTSLGNTHPTPLSKDGRSGLQSNLTSAIHLTNTSQAAQQLSSRTNHPFLYTHSYTTLVVAEEVHNDAWSVKFDGTGDTLWTSGSEGGSKIWQRQQGSESYEIIGQQTQVDETDSDIDSFEEIDSET